MYSGLRDWCLVMVAVATVGCASGGRNDIPEGFGAVELTIVSLDNVLGVTDVKIEFLLDRQSAVERTFNCTLSADRFDPEAGSTNSTGGNGGFVCDDMLLEPGVYQVRITPLEVAAEGVKDSEMCPAKTLPGNKTVTSGMFVGLDADIVCKSGPGLGGAIVTVVFGAPPRFSKFEKSPFTCVNEVNKIFVDVEPRNTSVTYSWKVEPQDRPSASFVLNKEEGHGMFSSNVTTSKTKPFRITVTATDILGSASLTFPVGVSDCSKLYDEAPFQIDDARALYVPNLDALVFEVTTEGDAGSIVPFPAGDVNGAPVLGYVFLTNLRPVDVGFRGLENRNDVTVALAVTSHPDFDDTPLWNEKFDNDTYGGAAEPEEGGVYHSHWVVLESKSNVLANASLAAVQQPNMTLLPPTAPMPMYLDSPGFAIHKEGDFLRVVVPYDRLRRKANVKFDAVTAYMQVDTRSGSPLLAVHKVYDTVNGAKPIQAVAGLESAPASSLPETTETEDATFGLESAEVVLHPDLDIIVFSMTNPAIATQHPVPLPAGAPNVNGATVLGYVFPTTISPGNVGFDDSFGGTVVLAVTSHPDFDDTPLWDENLNGIYANDLDDGKRYHVHWAVLNGDGQGLFVPSTTDTSITPPTSPMPMYLDSPGFSAYVTGENDERLNVIVPIQNIRLAPGDDVGFQYDALTTRMRVAIVDGKPTLRVEEVFDKLSPGPGPTPTFTVVRRPGLEN